MAPTSNLGGLTTGSIITNASQGIYPTLSLPPYPSIAKSTLLSVDTEKANTNNNNMAKENEKTVKPLAVILPPVKATSMQSGSCSPSEGSCNSDTIFQV